MHARRVRRAARDLVAAGAQIARRAVDPDHRGTEQRDERGAPEAPSCW